MKSREAVTKIAATMQHSLSQCLDDEETFSPVVIYEQGQHNSETPKFSSAALVVSSPGEPW